MLISIRRRVQLLLIDLFLLAGAGILALMLRDNLVLSVDRLHHSSVYLFSMLGVAALVLPAAGVDRTVWRLTSLRDLTRTIFAITATILGAVLVTFAINRLEGLPRSIPLLHFVLSVVALGGIRSLARIREHRRRARRHAASLKDLSTAPTAATETVLIVGMNRISELYTQALADFAPQKVQLAGLVGRSARHVGRLVGSVEVLGVPEDIKDIVRTLEIHGVFVTRIVVTESHSALSVKAREALMDLERTSNIEVQFLSERLGLDGVASRVETKPVASIRTSSIVSEEEMAELARRPYWRLKRVLDFCLALALIVLLAPVALVVALIVMFDVGLPVVFWQVRPGRFTTPFKLFKFRTMRAAHAADGSVIPDAKRTSKIGHFLRRTRLDELPQLLHILTGQMSFVGPRPLLPVDQDESAQARLIARPGLTGWAQVVGGRTISVSDKALLDVWYVRNASLALDVYIMLATVPMVLFGERVDYREVRRARRQKRAKRP